MTTTTDATATPADPPADPVERLLAEGPIGMSAAAKRLGSFRDGKPTHVSTLTRWAAVGVKLADGRVLKLEVLRLNGRLATTWPAVVRFVRAQQDPLAAPAAPTVRGRTDRRAASEAAGRQLERAGI